MKKKLDNFYSDLREIMKKHNLVMECWDEYDGAGNWYGQSFTLRSKNATNGRYDIYVSSLKDFVYNGSD